MSQPKLVPVGIITSAHGIRGQVKIRSFTDNPEEIFALGPLTDKAYVRTYVIGRRGASGESLIAAIDGIADRNSAELLKNTTLYASAEKVPEKKSFVGFEARTKDGKAYGTVIGIYNFGAGDIIEFTRPGGKTEMLPLNKDFIGKIDEKNGTIIVFPPEYIEANDD